MTTRYAASSANCRPMRISNVRSFAFLLHLQNHWPERNDEPAMRQECTSLPHTQQARRVFRTFWLGEVVRARAGVVRVRAAISA